MDALSHNLEAYCAPGYHPMADGIAVEGMRLVKEYLPRAVRERHGHRGARAHARRVVDGRDGVSEGARRDAQPESPVLGQPRHASWAHERRRDAVRARVEPRGDSSENSHGWRRTWGCAKQSFDGVLNWVLDLRRADRHPAHARRTRCRGEHARPFAPQALSDPSTGGNPLPMTAADFEQLYLNCIRGELTGRPEILTR